MTDIKIIGPLRSIRVDVNFTRRVTSQRNMPKKTVSFSSLSGSGPDRGQSPVELEDFLSVHPPPFQA